MNLRLANVILLTLTLTTLSGCELIEDVFQAGMWFILFLIVLVIAILVLIFNKAMDKPEKGANIIPNKSTDPG